MWWPELVHLSSYYTPQRIITFGLAHNAMGYWVAFVPALIIWIALYSFDRLNLRPTELPLGKAMQYLFVPLLCGFLGGAFNNAVDLDHISLFFGHMNGRVCHGALLILSAVLMIISGIGLFLTFCGYSPKKESHITGLLIFFVCSLSVISHVVEDFSVGWF